jgi:hypothetical protein
MAFNLIMIGFTLILLTWVVYLAAIPREKVPARPVLHVVVMVFGLIAMVTGLSSSLNPLDILAVVLGLSGIGLAALFLFLLTIARLPDGDLRVAVGDTMLAFAAPDSSGKVINSDDWRGQRILLKFFRGKW